MKTAAEIANHPKARLHRELVHLLRAHGNAAVAVVAWREIRRHPRLWERVVKFGLDSSTQQEQLNCIAFPEHNYAEVEAALDAGNNLRTLGQLASGRAWIARDDRGNYKQGRKGLRVFLQPSLR
jgi:hypothetical protein